MEKKNIETFCPASQQEWREWLAENHDSKQSVWLVYYKKKSGKRTLSWSNAVDEALCFGWIDSTARPIDEYQYMQFFSKRKPSSVWSKINKDKVRELTESGKMTQAGFDSVNIAKQNGSWTILDEAEDLNIPEDLTKEFKSHAGSEEFFLSLSPSVRKMALHRIVLAKRPETRHKRVLEVAEKAGKGLKPI